MKGIYFDYAATTPISKEVWQAMRPFLSPGLSGVFGNPSALHASGQEALRAIDAARMTLAQTLGLHHERVREIIFTGSATEANNLAIRGTVMYARKNGIKKPKIVVSAIEHESVYETARECERMGIAECVILPVTKEGVIETKYLHRAIDDRTVLVSVMYVNNETGVIQPISQIAEIIRGFRNKHAGKELGYPRFHVDAVQAFQYLSCNPDELGVDMLTLSAHKMYGPKGVGVLYARHHTSHHQNEAVQGKKIAIEGALLAPIITGGNQEFGIRAGTENVASIVGCAAAAQEAVRMRESHRKKVLGIKRAMWQTIQDVYPRAEINGESIEKGSPHILNIWLPGIPNELLLIQFDRENVAVSAGSACHARAPQPSRVISEMHSKERAKESIRLSFGAHTRRAEVEVFRNIFHAIIERYKA